MSFSSTRRCSLRVSPKKKFPIIQSFCIVLRNFHVRDFVMKLIIKAAKAKNSGSEYAASNRTMFTFCF